MFHLRKIPKKFTKVGTSFRLFSSTGNKPLLNVTVDEEGIATVQMQRAPVNSINFELMQELHNSICEVEKNKCKGMILTSVLPTIFSAGLELTELHKPDVKKFAEFTDSMYDAMVKLYGTDLITTIAMNGYTGAAACMFALTFEYRTMTTGKATIGLNDTAVGIPPAQWVAELMTRTMGARHAEYALTSSFMFSAEQALQVGLIDEVATDKADAIQKCKSFIKTYDNISPAARTLTKRSLRHEFLSNFERNRNQYKTNFIDTITSPVVQDKIEQYVQNLKQKKTVTV